MQSTTGDAGQFVTVRGLAERFDFVREGEVRAWIFDDFNDFRTRCCRKIEGRILISLPAFAAWMITP